MEKVIEIWKWLVELVTTPLKLAAAMGLGVIIYLGFQLHWQSEDYKELQTAKSKLEETRNTDNMTNNKDCNDRISKALIKKDSVHQLTIDNLNNEVKQANAYNRELINQLMAELASVKRGNAVVKNKANQLEEKINN